MSASPNAWASILLREIPLSVKYLTTESAKDFSEKASLLMNTEIQAEHLTLH